MNRPGPYDRGNTINPPPRMRMVVDTYEREDDGSLTLVVQHVFYGHTQGDCLQVAGAHRNADAFFRSCAEGGNYKGIACTNVVRFEEVKP